MAHEIPALLLIMFLGVDVTSIPLTYICSSVVHTCIIWVYHFYYLGQLFNSKCKCYNI